MIGPNVIILIRRNEVFSLGNPPGHQADARSRLFCLPPLPFLRVIKDARDCKRWAPVLADEPANVSTEIFMMIVYGPYVY